MKVHITVDLHLYVPLLASGQDIHAELCILSGARHWCQIIPVKSFLVTRTCAACRSIIPNRESYKAMSPLCPAAAAALLGTCPLPANCISRGLLFNTFCCRNFCLPMLTPPAHPPGLNTMQTALIPLLPQVCLSDNTNAEAWDDYMQLVHVEFHGSFKLLASLRRCLLWTHHVNNRPEVTRMISLPPLTRVSSCSTRAPSRPRASLLSCPLVTQAVPIYTHSTLRLRL